MIASAMYDGGGNDYANGVTVDNSGNVYRAFSQDYGYYETVISVIKYIQPDFPVALCGRFDLRHREVIHVDHVIEETNRERNDLP